MRRIGILMATLLALLVAACGGGETVADGGQVEIALAEFEFDPSEIRLTPGTTVTFVLENIGEKDHEFMIGREVHVEDGIPHGFETDFFDTVEGLTIEPADALETGMEGMGDESMSTTTMGDMEGEEEMEDMEDMGVMVVRAPTETATITFTVTEASIGEWEIGCFEEDGAHWDDGMKGTLIVEEG